MAGGTPDPGSIIYLKDWLTLGALLLGPILAVWWTLNHQKRAEKRNAKERLFMTLMAHRKSPPNLEWATALNLIDVVYSNYPNIVALWHSMYEIASQGQAGASAGITFTYQCCQKWRRCLVIRAWSRRILISFTFRRHRRIWTSASKTLRLSFSGF